jgi:hypothetical protein
VKECLKGADTRSQQLISLRRISLNPFLLSLDWQEKHYLETVFGSLRHLSLQSAIEMFPLEKAFTDPSTPSVVLSLLETLLISEIAFGEIQRIERQLKQESDFIRELATVLRGLVQNAPPVPTHHDPRTDPMLAKDFKEEISGQNRVRWILGAEGPTRGPEVILPRIRTTLPPADQGAIEVFLRRVTTGLRRYHHAKP